MAASAGSQHRCVFVGNIPYDATEEQLIQICEEVGPVVSFRLVLDRETGKPKGYGFCEYKDEETALSARRNLQGYEINGRQLRVDFAENDKGADRNREQGRGGPGMTSDAHKAFPGASNPVDSSLHQPLGHQLAASAASSMARALGGAQSSSLPLIQNGVQNLSGLGSDPLTQYLAKTSRQQLMEIMSEMRALVVQNKPLAQQLLQGIPQLPKALFQAEIMLGMVTPQMMQMANTRQPLSSVPQPALHNTYNQNPLLSSHPGQTPSQASSALANPVLLQHSVPPLQHVPVQPPYQQPLPPQPQLLPQGTITSSSGVPIYPQSFGSHSQFPPLPNPKGLISQVQPSLLPQSRLGGATNTFQHPQPPRPDSLQQSYFPHPPTSQQSGLSNYSVLPNGRDSFQKEAGTTAAASHDSTWGSMVGRVSSSGAGLAGQTGAAGDSLEAVNHQSKRPRLDDGSGARLGMTERTSTIGSLPPQSISGESLIGSQITNADAEKQTPELPADVESALLQQVMNLTPEQISALPLEQQQQVLLLQQHLMKQNL